MARYLCPITMLLALISGSLANDAPEYLNSQTPIVSTLDQVPSTTANFGVTPDSWLRQDRSFALHPSHYLPRWRNKYFARTGIPFFDDSLITVQTRFYHRYSKSGGQPAEATAGGGAIGLETGWLKDLLRFTTVGYTSQKLYGPPDRDGSGLLRDNQQSYTVLGEAFLELKLHEESSLFAGRIPVEAPYINNNDFRMTPNTFEGFGIRSLAVPKLQFGGGHITRIKFRNSSNFIPMSERAGGLGSDKGVTTAGARYNFTDDIYLGGVNHYGWDTFNTFYLESDRLMHLTDDLSLRLGGQFTDQRSVGAELVESFSTQSFGLKASIGYRGMIASTSWTRTTDGGEIRNPWGGSPSYNSSLISDFDRAGEDSLRIRASYDFTEMGITGLAAAISYIHGDVPEDGRDAYDEQEITVTLDYRPPVKVLESMWFRVQYARNERDQTSSGFDREEYRFILNYSYSF